jgi:hypothetical protein
MQKKDQPQKNINESEVNDEMEQKNTHSLSHPEFEQNTQSHESDSGIDLYREEHGDLTNNNT